ncbi:MAG: oligopeptidase A, partial [Pseudomonadales bacterium]
MPNPLLEPHLLPPFSRIQPEHVEPAIRQLIETNKLRIEELLATDKGHTWGNLLQPIEELEDGLAKAWSPVSHLNSVCNSEALREAYNACLPLLSEYSTWMGQHSDLCAAYQQIVDGKAFATLDTAQQKSINQSLRDFRLAGVALPPDKKKDYGELRQRLSKLGSTFGENVLDATS